MASKFIKLKRAIIPVMTAVIIASQLSGCAVFNSNEMLDMINNGEDIVIELAIPDYEINVQGQQVKLTRVQLDSLKTYMENGFRDDFDKLFGITPLEAFGNVVSKQGCIYINRTGFQDGNTSFMDSLRNKIFMETFAENEDKLGELGEVAYADVDADSYDAVIAALNAYYNLFAEAENGEDDYFNPTQSVTRGEFYSFVYRASNGVVEDLGVITNIEDAVGISALDDENIVYASQVESSAWLNSSNTGLRAGNYKQSISRAEAVYMLLNQFMSSDFRNFSVDGSGITLGDATDGGRFDGDTDKSWFSSNALVDKEGNLVAGYELGALSKMLTAGDGQVQSDLYKALVMAAKLGIIDAEETRYNEPVSRSEAIDMFIKTMEALNESEGYLTTEIPVVDVEEEYIEDTEYPTKEEVEKQLGIELPPVEVWYVRDYDADLNGTISKDEWEKWCADHPEDKNQNMHIDEDELPQTQTPTPDTSGNPDPGSEQTTKPSTGGNTSSGNSGQTSKPNTSTPSTQTPSTQTPSTQTPSTQTPSTQTPSTQTPSTQTPSTQAPSSDITPEEQEIYDKNIEFIEQHGGVIGDNGGFWLP